MGNYQHVTALRPAGIEKKRAFLVGGGIGSLAAAAYLIRDGHMTGDQITILEELDVAGGSLDASGNPPDGYLVRGGREMEEHDECLWDLLAHVPGHEQLRSKGPQHIAGLVPPSCEGTNEADVSYRG